MPADEGRPLHEAVGEHIDGEVLSSHPGPVGRPRRRAAWVVALATLLVLPFGLSLHGARSSPADPACGGTTSCGLPASLLSDATVVATLHDYCPRLRRLRSADLDTHLLRGGEHVSPSTGPEIRSRIIGIPVVGDRVRGLVEVRCPGWACRTPEPRPTAPLVAVLVIR